MYGKYVNEVWRLWNRQYKLDGDGCETYGQDMIDTTAIPMMMALLTLYDMRYVVNTPPMNTPIQSWKSRLALVRLPLQLKVTYGRILHFVTDTSSRFGIQVLRGTAGDIEGSSGTTAGDQANSRRIRQTDEGKE